MWDFGGLRQKGRVGVGNRGASGEIFLRPASETERDLAISDNLVFLLRPVCHFEIPVACSLFNNRT
jgi:hypothetical protein